MVIHNPFKNIYLIDLDQKIEGFRNFISSWLVKEQDTTILVDTGPRSTIPVLRKALKDIGVSRIDYILLTHIHIDHAGGTGLLIEDFPETKVICHPRGLRHMVNPSRLWEGSKVVLGPLTEVYGEIAPIPDRNIAFMETISAGRTSIEVLQTPGHAPHHLSFLMGDILFAGEVAGINCPVENGIYIRPATPPQFIYEIYKKSLDDAASLPASKVCFAHYGMRDDPEKVFALAQRQLDKWLSIIKEHIEAKSPSFEAAVFDDILKKDEGVALFDRLPEDIQKRERSFAYNSIRGMKTYLEETNADSQAGM